MTIPEIDWTGFGEVCQTQHCRCGASYRSHSKFVATDGKLKHYSKDPCPSCGSHSDMWKTEGDRESWSI